MIRRKIYSTLGAPASPEAKGIFESGNAAFYKFFPEKFI
jgi:hypothetical protein